jgi:beta-N-acetylhexosaminidase
MPPIPPLMLDLQGLELSPAERDWLAHPAVGGIILFARNYAEPAQLKELISSIRRAAKKEILLAVDQEGGRVQRLRQGFTRLPPAAKLGELYQQDPEAALAAAEALGFLMAAEVKAVGVDLSFAPVLDLGGGASEVIGDRAFAAEPEAVAALGGAFAHGMRRAGMAAVGKHFPGHGGVAEDSHLTLPEDGRSLKELEARDLVPFQCLIEEGLEAVMCAHVRYPQVDALPAGFSPVWIRQILRVKLGFAGAVFSDDLAMAGAAWIGDLETRVEAALEAGCDMLLVCNCPESVELLDRVKWRKWLKSERSAHLEKLKGDKVQIAPEAIQAARQAIKVLHE